MTNISGVKTYFLQVETKFSNISLFVEEIALLEVKWHFKVKIDPFFGKKSFLIPLSRCKMSIF